MTITGNIASNTNTSNNVTLTGKVDPTSIVSGYHYTWYQIPEYRYASTSGFTPTVKEENGEIYYNFKFTKGVTDTNNWYSISFPVYQFTAENTYKIHFKYRINAISNTQIGFRHAAISNDYGTSGRIEKYASSVTNGWVEEELIRAIPAQVTQNESSSNSSPRFEIYTNNLSGSAKSIDFDLKDVWIEEVQNSSKATTANQLGQQLTDTGLTHAINSTSYNTRFILKVTTGAGTERTSNTYLAKIDKQTPTAPVIQGGVTSWSQSNLKISIKTDSTSPSGIKNYQYCEATTNSTANCSWNNLASGTKEVTISTNGTRYIFFRAISNVDIAGSVSNVQTTMIETSNPTTPVIQGGSSSWSQAAKTISVKTASSATSGIKNYQYYISTNATTPTGGNWTNCTTSNSSQSISTEGTRYIFFRAVSNAGRTSAASTSQTTMIEINNPTAPGIQGGSSS